MSAREQELAERHEKLRLQCVFQRRAVGAEVKKIQAPFGSVDRFAIMTRSTLLQPRVIVGGIIALLVFGRLRAMNRVGRAYLLIAAARRLWRMVKLL